MRSRDGDYNFNSPNMEPNKVSTDGVTDVARDMNNMHNLYGVHEATENFNPDKWKKFLEFRLNFLKEELDETMKAAQDGDPEEIVDGLIDLVVIAVGTCDLFKIDFNKAWKEVLRTNLTKEVGIKESRPNKLGLPDLIKPAGWVGPNHAGNHGKLQECFH